MILDKRQLKIVEDALNDYDFMKKELEDKINNSYYNLENLSNFILRFRDTEITNLEQSEFKGNYYGYLDFIYKDLNMCVSEDKDGKKKVSNTFEIYDKVKQEYIVEDFCTKEEYYKMIIKSLKEGGDK